jgi:carotenoid 1,2-hydratase
VSSPFSADSPLHFDRPVAADGYVWWYLDALSDDGRHGLTLIAMLGCVFSPYYAWARRRGPTDPLEHCAMNVALYGGSGRRWAMTERPAHRLERGADHLVIGPSSMHWQDGELRIDIDERTAPLPRRLRGQIRVHPGNLAERRFTLDAAGRHRWRPYSPRCRVELEFTDPALRWQGDGYLDSNDGDRPLEADFQSWTWSRGSRGERTTVLYDVERRGGERFGLALDFDAQGAVTQIDAPPSAALPGTPWRMARSTRSDAGFTPRVIETLEDGPFYARSVLGTQIGGEAMTAVHESLSLDRFGSRWIQALLPVRMPRSTR